MIRKILLGMFVVALSLPGFAQTTAGEPSWVEVSNEYTKKVLDVEMKHRPESGSDQGLSQYDALASQPTLADENRSGKKPRRCWRN